jgi:ice-binding like protein
VSNRILKRTGRVAAALAVGCAFAVPAAHAATANVDLGTATPFSVLAYSTVTNTGSSSMWGNLGLTPGSSVTGAPAVGGATYVNDPGNVALNAKNALTNAHVNTANRVSSGGTGADLAGQVFKTGVWTASTQLNLTGVVTLDGENNPNSVFIFQVPTSLTTGVASRVALINRANPCNVYWVVGAETTLDTGTSFVGTVMGGTAITDNGFSTVNGRLLVNTDAVNLHTTTIVHSACTANDDNTNDSIPAGPTAPGGTGGTPTTPAGSTPANQAAPASQSATPTRAGTARLARPPRSRTSRRNGGPACTAGFRAKVSGRMIRRVIFRLDGRYLGTDTTSAFTQRVKAASAGRHVISARVGFKDATHSRTLKFRYRACAAQALRPRQGPSQFTG